MDYAVTGVDNSTVKVHLNITYSLIFSRMGSREVSLFTGN